MAELFMSITEDVTMDFLWVVGFLCLFLVVAGILLLNMTQKTETAGDNSTDDC